MIHPSNGRPRKQHGSVKLLGPRPVSKTKRGQLHIGALETREHDLSIGDVALIPVRVFSVPDERAIGAPVDLNLPSSHSFDGSCC